MNVVVGILVIIGTGLLLSRRYQPQAVLLGMGLVMVAAAYGLTGFVLSPAQSTGVAVFDFVELLRLTVVDNLAGLGLMIMTCAGYAKYMEHIGAGTRMARTVIGPLYKLKRPYLLLGVLFLVNMALSICVPNPLSLALLMMVTMYPVLTRLGISPIGAAAVIATGHLLDIGPGAVSTLLMAQIVHIPVPQYFVGYQLRVYVVVAVATAVAHALWQRYLDHREARTTTVPCESLDEAPLGPMPYMFLPLLPLCFILGFSQYGIPGIKMNVTLAMFLALGIAMVCELLRHRKLKVVTDSLTIFFNGMGEQFKYAVTLVIAGQVFAQGIMRLDLITEPLMHIVQLHGAVITLVMSWIMGAFTILTGSHVASVYSFAPLVPNVLTAVPDAVIPTLLAMQNGATLGLFLTPISPVIVGVAGVAHVSPMNMLRRTIVPVIVAFVTSWIAIWALYL